MTGEEPKDTDIPIHLGERPKCINMNTNIVQQKSTQILTILGRDQQIHFVSSLIRPHLDAFIDDNNNDGDDDEVYNNDNNDDAYCPARDAY